MSKNHILDGEAAEQMFHALDLINASLGNLQKISDNLISENIVKQGLQQYIDGLLKILKEEKNININVTYKGDIQSLSPDTVLKTILVFNKLIDYLIGQINPSQIELELTCIEGLVTIHEKDNGKFFNMAVMTYPGITESENIKSLAESLNGNFVIYRRKIKGNEINITINR
jgi:hypothetical protein